MALSGAHVETRSALRVAYRDLAMARRSFRAGRPPVSGEPSGPRLPREPATAVQDLDPVRHTVTAVVVAHDGARWLPETLAAVRAQSRPVQRVVAADTGSTDGSGDILAEYLPEPAVVTLDARTGYGDAVRAALELPRSRTGVRGAGEESTEWLWLIHDDCTPDPDALRHLLAAADDDPRAAVLGPKLRDWFDRRVLVEAGVTIDGAGRRETGLEPREFDHGQHDGSRQVLAVSSAGMLVRRDVWDRLGGFDRMLPLFRDDIDFCWRVGGAGHRVRLVTDAVAYHAEASARRRRPISATRNHPRRIDRRHAMFVLLANLPFGGMVGALLRNSAASLLRVLMYLLMKQPANALDEAAAITSVYLTPFRLVRARFRRRRDRRRTYSAIRPYLARGVAMRQFGDAVAGLLSGSPVADTAGRHQAVTAPPSPEDEEEPLQDDHGPLRRFLLHPAVLLVLGLTAVTLVAERSLLLGGTLAGGALPPVVGGASDLWDLYLAGRPDSGLAAVQPVPPYVGLLAVLSTLTFGKPWLAVTIILLGCVPLAGITAYVLARQVLHYRPARLWMAGSYALLPMATGAVSQGRLGTALVHALLPVLGLLLVRILTMPERQSRRAAWGLGLTLAAATAFVPLVWLLSLVTGVLVAAAFGHVGRRIYVSIAIALAVPVVLLLPWTLELLRHPSMWLLEAGLHRPELSAPGPSPHELLMLSPGGPGSPPLWVTGGFVAAALCALLLLRNRVLVAAGWSLALFGILVAILTSRLIVEPHYGGPPAPVWPGVALAFAATAMLMSAATAAQSFGTMLRLGGARRLFALGVAALAVTSPLSAAAVWMWNGVDGPLSGDAPPIVPGVLRTLSAEGAEPRTLVLHPAEGGAVHYRVVRGEEPRIGEEQIAADPDLVGTMDDTVAGIVAGQGGDQARVLADLGIGYVLYPRPEITTAADTTMVDTLDGTPGLTRQSLSAEFALWRLQEETGALRIVSGDDEAPQVLRVDGEGGGAEVPAGDEGRRLVMAEPAHTGWRATLDGEPLAPTETGIGTQAFELPAAGGRLEVSYRDVVATSWLVHQGVLLLVVLVLAAPGARTEEDVRLIAAQPAPRPRRPRRPGGGDTAGGDTGDARPGAGTRPPPEPAGAARSAGRRRRGGRRRATARQDSDRRGSRQEEAP